MTIKEFLMSKKKKAKQPVEQTTNPQPKAPMPGDQPMARPTQPGPPVPTQL
jgi:hypothetical protein